MDIKDSKDIKEINLRVATLVKQETTQVSYDTWLKYIEYAYMEENNIIIEVRNLFEKTILEDRYLCLLDNVYSKFMDELNYSKILIRVVTKEKELETKEITAKEAKELADKTNAESADMKEKIDEKLKDLYEMVKFCASSGEYEYRSAIDYPDTHLMTKSIIEHLEINGYKIEIKTYTEGKTGLIIKW